MSASVESQLSSFAVEVLEGLSAPQKKISPRFLYDDLGTALFEAITLLPEYGLTRADERLLRIHASDIVMQAGAVAIVAELGSGSGKKTRHVLEGFCRLHSLVSYRPIDVSQAALTACEKELETLCEIRAVCDDWLEGLRKVTRERGPGEPLLLMFLGSSIGNLDREEVPQFLRAVRANLKPGDWFLLGVDLVKDVGQMLAAYDDPTGVTAAFNLNLLGRLNREMDADFDLRTFAHEARWNAEERRIEMHLLSGRDQDVYLGALDKTVEFRAGETIWTESSHKFTLSELDDYARSSGFQALAAWTDQEWTFTEALWRAA
ncbi:MAG TPA: L-histidine N(alpha)-methyltransferase [Bryobacteraceae bacterium]|nr:L-histidine N(alpha)-methyltransferase [Bryobacteraceae bacterium]